MRPLNNIIETNNFISTSVNNYIKVEIGSYYTIFINGLPKLANNLVASGADTIAISVYNYGGRKAVVNICKATGTIITLQSSYVRYYKLT